MKKITNLLILVYLIIVIAVINGCKKDPVVPTLTTTIVSEITLNTAISGGKITNDGGSTITARGVCWGTSQSPTTKNNLTTNETGTGTFVSNLAGLLPGTTYYLRAYATNSAGTAYGNEQNFTTFPVSQPTLTTTAVSVITSSTAISGGTISSDGGAAITARGICWSISESPLITDNIATDPEAGIGSFVSNLTGLSDGTTYYYRAYATNSAGTTYGNQLSFITPVTDIEGNLYKTVAIGTQIWMAENLKTTRYNDNSDIPNETEGTVWITLTTPAYSWYGNTIANKDIYGAMYNWFTVATGNLCPAGWHEPTDAEYNTLEVFLGVPLANVNDWGWRGTDQGIQLKSTTGWDAEGNGTNTSGFTALPGGYRHYGTSNFWGLGTLAYLWSSSDDAINGNPTVAWYRQLDAANVLINKMTTNKTSGKYVRCVKDN